MARKSKKTRVRLTAEENAKIRELLSQGLSIAAVAYMANRSVSSVYKIFKLMQMNKAKSAAVSHLHDLTVTPRSE